MNERRLSATQKKVIFIVGIYVIFIGAALFSFIDPESKGSGFGRVITTLPPLVGLCAAFLIQDKTRIFKAVIFCLGLGLILSTWWFLSLSDVGKLLGLYVGGFWAGTKWSKSDIVAEVLDKKDGHDQKK